tara:strand:+ start:45 stop:554 length:510 start_codon:yes stop_codon:yes gene_type:complete
MRLNLQARFALIGKLHSAQFKQPLLALLLRASKIVPHVGWASAWYLLRFRARRASVFQGLEIDMTTVTFMGIDCEIDKRAYPHNKQPALQLFAADSPGNREMGIHHGAPVLTATACLPDFPFQEGETAIKDYSENEGILDVLVQAKIIELTGKSARSGFCNLPVVKLLV